MVYLFMLSSMPTGSQMSTTLTNSHINLIYRPFFFSLWPAEWHSFSWMPRVWSMLAFRMMFWPTEPPKVHLHREEKHIRVISRLAYIQADSGRHSSSTSAAAQLFNQGK